MNSTQEQARHDYELDDLATKRDLKELELKLEVKIAETKAELIRWVVGVGLLQITIITALVLKLATRIVSSPHGVQRNAGFRATLFPHSALLHAGYLLFLLMLIMIWRNLFFGCQMMISENCNVY